MPRKKVSTTVYIEADQAARLKLLGDATRVPVAAYIREGINLVLEKYKQHLPDPPSDQDLTPAEVGTVAHDRTLSREDDRP